MKIARAALLAASGLIASTLFAAAQVGDISAAPLAATSETAAPQTADATAAMHALLREGAVTFSPVPAENAYDFNAPGGIPGFGPIDSATADRRLAQIIIWE
jgi:hypothetical protein